MSDYGKGDRVLIEREELLGTVHEIWPGGEDTVEILLDDGTYVCRDPEHLAPVAQPSERKP